MRPFVVHSLDQARAAVATAAQLGVPIEIHSAPGAGAFAGVAWFERVIAAARADYPQARVTAILDCADAPGAVLEAVRWLKEPGRTKVMLRFTGDAATAARLADIASQAGIDLTLEPVGA